MKNRPAAIHLIFAEFWSRQWGVPYLSQQFLEVETEEQKAELIMAIKNGSVVSWRHINLHGEYDFSDERLQDSVGLDLAKIITLKLA